MLVAVDTKSPPQLLQGGTCSETWKITTAAQGDFVMGIASTPMQRISPKDVNHLEHFLFENGVSMAEPIGELGYMPDKTRFFDVHRMMPGISFNDLPGREMNAQQAANLGEALATAHIYGREFHTKHPCELHPVTLKDRANFVRTNRRNDTNIGPHFLKGTFVAVGNNILRASRAVAHKFSKDYKKLPRGIIHGDFNFTNVLFNDDTPIIIDWSNVTYAPMVTEVAKALVEFVILPEAQKNGAANQECIVERARDFLEAYNRQRPLTHDEKSLMVNLLASHIFDISARTALGQSRRYAEGGLPQGTLLQNAIDELCRNQKFLDILENLEPAPASEHRHHHEQTPGR